MRLFEVNKKETVGEEEFPLKSFSGRIVIGLDFDDVEVPDKAARRIAYNLLHDIAETLSESDLHEMDEKEAKKASPLPSTEPAIATNNGAWRRPEDLDMRIVKSAHRIIVEVAKRGVGGRSVLASDLVGAVGLSAPTVGRLLREGDEAHDYLAPFINVTPHGRTKAVDLTEAGRVLASKIRAGVVPS